MISRNSLILQVNWSNAAHLHPKTSPKLRLTMQRRMMLQKMIPLQMTLPRIQRLEEDDLMTINPSHLVILFLELRQDVAKSPSSKSKQVKIKLSLRTLKPTKTSAFTIRHANRLLNLMMVELRWFASLQLPNWPLPWLQLPLCWSISDFIQPGKILILFIIYNHARYIINIIKTHYISRTHTFNSI